MAPVVDARGSQARREQGQEPRHDPKPEVRPERPAGAAPPAEGGRCAEHAEGHAGGAQRDGIGADGRHQRRPQGREDEERGVVRRAYRAFEGAADVPEREGIEGEVQRVFVEEVRREQSPGLAPVQDERSGLGAVDQKRRERDAGSQPAGGHQDPDRRQEQPDRHPGDTRDGQRLGCRRPQGCGIARRLWKTGFFRPRRHLLEDGHDGAEAAGPRPGPRNETR